MTATWQPPVDTPPAGSVHATETAAACIHRACATLDELHGVPTLAGARSLDLTREIREAAEQMAAELKVCGELLHEALEDLHAINDDQMGT